MKVLAHMKRIINKGKKYCYNRLESYAIEHNRGRMVTISVSDLFYNHIRNMELSRCDIVVRYLAIENYFGKNNRGFEMYTKMQRARKKWFAPSSNISEETDSCTAANQFKELIASYEKSGYDRESHIILDRSLSLIDGSHRMALALYYGIKNITALVIHFDHPVDYSIDWFLHVGFSQEEIDLITDTGVKLRDRCNQPFSCVIWSPAVKLSDAIVHDLGYYGKVESVKKYSYEREEYKNIVRAVYAIDDIENWKVEKKLEHMSGGELVVVGLKIEEPSFRVKTASDKPISQRVERIKRAIRGRYREDIEDYFFDTILHIADNHQQSHYMEHIFETGIDFREVLEILKGHKYALIKVDVPFMPEDFPKRIPVGKDVDILCAKQDLEAIKGKLICLVQKYTEYEVVKKESADRLLLRLNLSGKTVFLLDCCSSYEGMPDEFLEYALQSRLFCEKGYYVLDPAAEAMIRRAAFHANGQKIYHQEYYEENRTEEIEAMFEKSRGGVLDTLIFELRGYLDSRQIPYEDVCIVGSFLLALYGIRKAHDLDFIVSSKYAGLFPRGAVKVTKNCEKVKKGWLRRGNQVVFSDDEIIESPGLCVWYKGFKVVKMPLVIYKKSVSQRQKDLTDLRLINKYLKDIETMRGDKEEKSIVGTFEGSERRC